MNKVNDKRKFQRVKRGALLYISGVIRTAPNDALNTIFHFYPLDLVAIEVATISALRENDTTNL